MLRKILVSAAVVFPMASAWANSGNVESIEELKAHCNRLEAHEQINRVPKGLICKGFVTKWMEGDRASFYLPTSFHAQGSTDYNKVGLYKTHGFLRADETRNEHGQCSVYKKVRMSAQNVVAHIDSCEDLSLAKVQAACEAAINEQCSGMFNDVSYESLDDSMSSSNFDEVCNVQDVETLSTCS